MDEKTGRRRRRDAFCCLSNNVRLVEWDFQVAIRHSSAGADGTTLTLTLMCVTSSDRCEADRRTTETPNTQSDRRREKKRAQPRSAALSMVLLFDGAPHSDALGGHAAKHLVQVRAFLRLKRASVTRVMVYFHRLCSTCACEWWQAKEQVFLKKRRLDFLSLDAPSSQAPLARRRCTCTWHGQLRRPCGPPDQPRRRLCL